MGTSRSYAVSVLLVTERPPQSAADDDLLHRAVAAIGPWNGKAFEPGSERAAAVLRRERPPARVTLVHPDFPEDAGGRPFWLSVATRALRASDTDMALVSAVMADAERIELQWEMGRTFAGRLIGSLHPLFASMNARPVDIEDTLMPARRESGKGFPTALTAYSYLGPGDVTQEQRTALASLPAPRSVPLDEGWLLELVDSPLHGPVPGLLGSIGEIAGHAVRYIAPMPPQGPDR